MDIRKISNRLVYAMAYDRNTFKDRVEECLHGAIREFYKAQLAKKNGFKKWTQHWTTEFNNLLDKLQDDILPHTIKGFKDKRKAVEEVIVLVKAMDEQKQASAKRIVLRDFKVKDLKEELDEVDSATFWNLLNQVINTKLM